MASFFNKGGRWRVQVSLGLPSVAVSYELTELGQALPDLLKRFAGWSEERGFLQDARTLIRDVRYDFLPSKNRQSNEG